MGHSVVATRMAGLAAIAALGAGCASGGNVPTAGTNTGLVPDLRGVRVMLLPVQDVRGLPRNAAAESEVVFALTDRSDEVDWATPERLRATAQRTPGLDFGLERLPVGVFLQREVRRIGDPLFGHLRRLGAVENSDLALIPIQVRFRPAVEGRSAAVEIAATLIQARTGRVVWFGIVEGQGSGPDDPAAVARAAQTLAQTLLPF